VHISQLEIATSIERDGFWLTSGVSKNQVQEVITKLGNVIQVTDVTIKSGRALVTSDKALDLHSDHPMADLICWHCREQSTEGGETILLDAYKILKRLNTGELDQLKRIWLYEHKVFDTDSDRFPFLSSRFGRDKIYYTFWLLKDELTFEQQSAFREFVCLTKQIMPIRIKLKPDDLLVIDNGRMLHGRTGIGGNKQRFLKRFWIEKIS
jgi:alpha-ketoglutarate-dependent taurine dioxygenase